MLQVTDKAKEELKRLLESSVDYPEARLRLLDRGGGVLGLGIDIESGDDQVVEYRGDRLLVVENALAARLGRTVLDIDTTPEGTELVIDQR